MKMILLSATMFVVAVAARASLYSTGTIPDGNLVSPALTVRP